MAHKISKVDVWAADIANRPGSLAGLLDKLAGAGARLEFVIARKVDENSSRVFLAPLKGKKQTGAAAGAGLAKANGMYSIRIDAPDKPGLGARICEAIAAKGINLRGVSAAAIGTKSVTYLAFDSDADRAQASKVVKSVLGKAGGR
ncbi:MAG: ACT domain-containing protein [Phycisphaerales bacterium]|nr:MAG: ACT domain-containing protein [Phycisphaerales bacterium]